MGMGRIKHKPIDPLWRGPLEDGVTQSMLSRFLVCQERFRVRVIEGIRPVEGFSHRMEFGNMWHLCEEHLAADTSWEIPLQRYTIDLGKIYPNDRKEIEHWYNVCRVTFPVYVEYWSKHKDVQRRQPLMQEEVFKIPYELPSGRVTYLRGKFDSVDILGKEGVFLQENKTKADINEEQLKAELPNTLQPMIYLTALQELSKGNGLGTNLPVKGVRYNVVRRPLGGGKHSITQRKGRKTKKGIVGAETKGQFYQRLGELIAENGDHFFMRWRVDITPGDLKHFQKEVINPILENLWDWWEWMEFCCAEGVDRFDGELRNEKFPHHVPRPFRFPFGVYNSLTEGRHDELNLYLTTGSMAGMQEVESLFRELQTEE